MVAEPIDLMMRRRVMADQQARKPKGAITGDAQVILDALDDLHLPESFKKFVKKIRKLTYYNAGFHVQDGTDEHTCYFSLKTWAEELGLSRQFLYNLRADLIAHQVITYTPIPESPHHGVIAWNMNVSEWTPFKKGGVRPGAGRPKKNQSVHKDNQSVYDPENQSVYETYSIGVQSEINRCTPDGNEASEGQGATHPLRNYTKKREETNSDANASGDAADADAPGLAPSAPVWDDETETAGATTNITPLQAASAKRRSSAAPAARASPPGDKDAALNAFRAACWKLLRDAYGQDVAKEGRELAAMKRLFDKKIPIEDVQGCWQATLLDPRWDTEPLTMAIVEEKMTVYRRGREGYRANMQGKRDNDNQRKQREGKANGKSGTRDRSPAIEHHASTRADVF